MKTAVVTGATGMIASALIRLLIGEGVNVFAVVRPGSAKLSNVPVSDLVTPVEADLGDLSGLTERIGSADWFFHFAWAGTGGAARNDAPLQSDNVRRCLDAVKLAADLGCGVFVGAGSQAEYGRTDAPLRPDTPTFPETAYGAAKLAAGQLGAIYARSLGLRHVWMRILSVYGPGDNDFTITTSSLKKLLTGKRASFTPAEQIWDFLYCDDAARAFYLAALYGSDGAVYPLGSGEGRPLKDYLYMMRDAAAPGAQLGIGELPYNDKQVSYLRADISDLRRDCGFEPLVPYKKGIALTVESLKKEL